MRGEADHNRLSCCIGQLLFDLRCMSVGSYAVCLDIFIDLAEKAVYFRASACAGGTGFCINDNGVWINETFFY
jgi:hypothetical protein